MGAETLEEAAEAERPRLLGIAYRMTGSHSDAEDIVQEALLRAFRGPTGDIESPAAYLTTITTRLAIDHLRSPRVRREAYVGPWLPVAITDDPAPDAAAHAVLADNLSMAFLIVLETLSPDERAVLLLHDVFAYSHVEIGAVLGRTDASSRQLLRRARQRLDDGRTRTDADLDRRDEITRRFVHACNGGDLEAFVELLTDDAVLTFDGGPDVRTAARHPIRGAERVARFLTYVIDRLADPRITSTILNGGPAVLVATSADELIGAVFVEPGFDGRIADIRWVRNPDKLSDVRSSVASE
jgi:RNA polymerase sigma-70 factor (ECF subfamily)